MSGQAEAGMAYRDIAASAYRAYSASTGNKNFRGDPMPRWDDLPAAIQIAWEAAARQVGYCIDGGVKPGDELNEERWGCWTPPPSLPAYQG